MQDPTLQSQIHNTPVTDFGMPVGQITPLQNIQKQLQTNAKTELQMSEFYKGFVKNQQPNSLDSLKDDRIKLTNYSVDINEAYDRLSTGEYTPRFKNFIQGTDNSERFAANQTTGEKWVNGVEKALLKTGNAVLGGTAGIVYGITAMASEGSLSALYDNDFSNTLSDWDTKLNYQLPNYYTKQESEKGLFGQAATANFWADKVLGGLSFTAGAIISEGIWAAATGGTSLAVSAAKWGARLGRGAVDAAKTGRWTVEALGEAGVLSAVAKNKGFLKQAINTTFNAGKINIKTATNLGIAADLLNTARFTVTSAGFESSVEALQYKKEATENFYNTFYNNNGREPDSEDIATFNENLKNSANAVFGVNMAIVGSSNLVTMGKLFELKNPIKTGLTEFIEKKAFGYGVNKTGANTYKILEATKAQKIARNVFAYGKAPVTEGLYEEGLQGVTTKVANKWLDHTYSNKNTAQTFSTMGAVYESLAEQYGTKEGWVENGVGMIIGVLGGTTNTRAELKSKQAELEFKAKGLETFNSESKILQQALLTRKVMMSNQIAGFSEDAKIESENGNVVKSHIYGEGVIHAFLNHKYALGESFEDAAQDVKTTLDTITPEQFKNAGIEEKDIDNYKEDRLNDFIDKSKQFKKNRKFSEYIIGKNPTAGEKDITSILGESFKGLNTNQALIESLTWVLTEGESAGKFMNDIQAKLTEEVSTEHANTLNTISSLNKLSGYKSAEINDATSRYNFLSLRRDKLQQDIARLNARPKETEGDRVSGKTLESKNLELLEINNDIAQLESTLEGYADELNKQKSYQQDINALDLSQDISGTTVTARDLLNLNENIEKFKNLVDSLKVSNPQRGAYISDLLDEYSQAEDMFLTNQRAVDMLTSGELKLDKINTWLGKKVFKNKSMDEASRDWLTDALNKYEKNVLSVVGGANQESNTPKTKEELIYRKEELEKELEALSEEDDRIEEINNELAEIEEQIKDPVNPNRNVQPQSEAEKVLNLSPIEDYKNRIEKMLAKGYYSLERIGKNYEDLKDLQPTEAEIEEFRNTNEEDERYEELSKKLSDWKLLDSATDMEGNSIADLVRLIKQLETPQKEVDTKVELTGEDIDFLQEGSESSGDLVVNELLQNYLAHAKVKKLDTGKYRFTHLQLSHLIDRLITDEVKPTVKGEVVTLAEIEDLKPGAVVTILNTEFTLGESGRIEIDVKKFGSIKQALGFELLDSGGNWSYHDIYEYKGGTWTKVESQYEDGTFEQSTSYELQKDDVVSFEIGNENGHNLKLYNAWINAQASLDESKAKDKTKLAKAVEENLKEFKNGIVIYAVDSKGRRIAPLKALRSGVAEEIFLQIRQRAFDNFNIELDKIDLKVTSKVVNVYLGTPQLLIFDGKTQNTSFTKESITQVEATGFIKDGEVTTSIPFPKGVDTTFITKIVKKNKGVGIPFVIITKGIHSLAYPVNLIKKPESKIEELNNLTANKEPNDKLLIINELIQKYNIQIEPLLFGDLESDTKMEEVSAAFENYESHVSLEDFSSSKYKKDSLIEDATINIDLIDMDNAISDPKVRISLDNTVVRFEESREVLKKQELDLVSQISNFVDKLYDTIYTPRGIEIKDRAKNQFIEMIINGSEKNIPTRITAGESQDSDTYRRVNKNLLLEASEYINDLDKDGKEVVGDKNIQEVKRLASVYKRVLEDLSISKKDKNSAIKNVECP